MDEIIALRHKLHNNPELSGKEAKTADIITSFLTKYKPNEILKGVAGNGIAAVYRGSEKGKTVLYRCDMDAVPISEANDLPYRSVTSNVAHLCGHDGHMAIASGLARELSQNPIKMGCVIILFQPEEETGQGAKKSVNWLKQHGLIPDYCIAIHNMPKFPFTSVIISRYTFSAASKGVIIKLRGKDAHAAYPESGINPSNAIAEAINFLNGCNELKIFNRFILVTIVHIRMGDMAFGTSPGYAEVMSTLRSFENSDMNKLTQLIESEIRDIAKNHHLEYEITYADEFPATICDPKLTQSIESIAKNQKRNIIYIDEPNRWSEDFAHFAIGYPSVIFGLGAGENHPDLHTNTYDFPDGLIPIGVKLIDELQSLLTKA